MAMTNTEGDITQPTRQLTYISSGVTRLFLSDKACTDLGFIPSDFPRVQEVQETQGQQETHRQQET